MVRTKGGGGSGDKQGGRGRGEQKGWGNVPVGQRDRERSWWAAPSSPFVMVGIGVAWSSPFVVGIGVAWSSSSAFVLR